METTRFNLLHRETLARENSADGSPGDFKLPGLAVHAEKAESVRYLGRDCLRVVDGLVVLTEPKLAALDSARIEVDIAAEGPAFPGVAFHIADRLNYELMYSQPHSSGEWDALQYDPVFHGSNTWQIYHGPKFQKTALIPTREWYTLVVEFDAMTASIAVSGQEPLKVDSLARPQHEGGLGIWTYLPAYFSDVRVYAPEAGKRGVSDTLAGGATTLPEGAITEWLVEGYGVVQCEPHGILNLNRYFPMALREVILTRRFSVESECKAVMNFGLSDDLTLSVDGLPIYTSTKPFRPTAGKEGRGYINFDTCKMTRVLSPGVHTLSVKLKVTEPYGWGLALSLTGESLSLLPVEF